MFVNQGLLIAANEQPIYMLPQMASRHGLITGATGTGKTVTVKVLAEAFSCHHLAPHWPLTSDGPILRPLPWAVLTPSAQSRAVFFSPLHLLSLLFPHGLAIYSLLSRTPPLPSPLGPHPHFLLRALVSTHSELPVSSSPSLLPPHRLSPLLRSIPVWPRDDGGPGHL